MYQSSILPIANLLRLPAPVKAFQAARRIMEILQAFNLEKSYKGRQVVRDVSIRVNKGEIVGLIGPNGAGKTTCF